MWYFLDNIFLPFMLFLLGGALIVLICLMGVMLFSEKIPLMKSDWKCTASHTEKSFIMAGKIMVPTTKTVCDRYERKK